MRVLPGVAIAASSALLCLWNLYVRPATEYSRPAVPAKVAEVANIAANPFGALTSSSDLLRLDSVSPEELGKFGSLSPVELTAPSNVPLPPEPNRFSLDGSYGDLANLKGSVSRGSFALLEPGIVEEAPTATPDVATNTPAIPPMPPRRPSSLGATPEPTAPPTSTAAIQGPDVKPAGPDVPGFFAHLFNGAGAASPANPVNSGSHAVAYAAPAETSAVPRSTRDNAILRSLTPSAPPGALARYDRYTAVYDIEARTVYLPDGTKLEAHSGLGELKDDPKRVNTRARGATPPDVYELSPREALFYGIQALRLKPVGSGEQFGRTGLLAHPYMLGPDGDSFGCVSFKDYDAFLQAFQSGQIKKLAVVAKLD